MDPPRSSLCPGYKHVASFSPSLSSPKSKNIQLQDPGPIISGEHTAEEEVDYEEEVEYVVLDLGNIEPTLVPSSSTYRLIGLDTSTPFLQLSGTVLRGRHENLLGSELIFTDEKDSSSTSTGQKKRGVMHVSTTSKRITFKEVQLRQREKASTPILAQATADIEGNVGPGEELLEDADDTMDIDDALEYVDLNIDPALRGTQSQPQAGPSRSTLPTVSSSISPPPSRSPSPLVFDPASPFPSFSSFISIAPDQDKPKDNLSFTAGVQEVPSDPTLRIDRLTGTSPPLTRAPRGSKKTVTMSSAAATGARTGSETTAKGKQKQKAKADMDADGSGMDTAEGR